MSSDGIARWSFALFIVAICVGIFLGWLAVIPTEAPETGRPYVWPGPSERYRPHIFAPPQAPVRLCLERDGKLDCRTIEAPGKYEIEVLP